MLVQRVDTFQGAVAAVLEIAKEDPGNPIHHPPMVLIPAADIFTRSGKNGCYHLAMRVIFKGQCHRRKYRRDKHASKQPQDCRCCKKFLFVLF